MYSIVLTVVLAFASTVFAAPNHIASAPAGTDLVRFPIIAEKSIPKTAKQEYELEALLELRPAVLRVAVRTLNHYRVDNSWRHETIATGTIVFADLTGTIRYKADCWNRLVVAEPSWLDRFLAWLAGIWDGINGMWVAVIATVLALIAIILASLRLGHRQPPVNPPPQVQA